MTNKTEVQKVIQAANYFEPEGAMIAGGALTSVFTGQPINDVDMYFKSRRSFEVAVEQAYDDGLWCASTTERAVTFVQSSSIIQMMHFDWFADAAAVFDCFDFTCCMAAYDCDTKELIFHDDFLKHASQRFLRFHAGTRFPFASLLRVLKYQARGYTIGKGDLLRISLACHKVPLASWDDLVQQIGGQYGETVRLGCDGDFSTDAAIEVLANGDFITPAQGEDQPGNAAELLRKVFGEGEKLAA